MTLGFQKEAVVVLTVKKSCQTGGMLTDTTFIAQLVSDTEAHCSRFIAEINTLNHRLVAGLMN